jgi:hypothetical protein
VRSQIKLGRIFGIEIGLHYSWFLIAFLIVLSLASQFRASNPEWGDGTITALSLLTGGLFFVSLLLHELSHSVFAKSHGIAVREITLFALGGVSQIEKNPTSARTEFWMAFVGPLTTAVIGVVCLGLRGVAGTPAAPAYAMFSWLGQFHPRLSVGRRANSATGPVVEERGRRAFHARGRQNRAGSGSGFHRGGNCRVLRRRGLWRAVDRLHRLVPVAGGRRELSRSRPPARVLSDVTVRRKTCLVASGRPRWKPLEHV